MFKIRSIVIFEASIEALWS